MTTTIWSNAAVRSSNSLKPTHVTLTPSSSSGAWQGCAGIDFVNAITAVSTLSSVSRSFGASIEKRHLRDRRAGPHVERDLVLEDLQQRAERHPEHPLELADAHPVHLVLLQLALLRRVGIPALEREERDSVLGNDVQELGLERLVLGYFR